eukprot:4037357-Pleurochrysis_carterae.AAC.1
MAPSLRVRSSAGLSKGDETERHGCDCGDGPLGSAGPAYSGDIASAAAGSPCAAVLMMADATMLSSAGARPVSACVYCVHALGGGLRSAVASASCGEKCCERRESGALLLSSVQGEGICALAIFMSGDAGEMAAESRIRGDPVSLRREMATPSLRREGAFLRSACNEP